MAGMSEQLQKAKEHLLAKILTDSESTEGYASAYKALCEAEAVEKYDPYATYAPLSIEQQQMQGVDNSVTQPADGHIVAKE